MVLEKRELTQILLAAQFLLNFYASQIEGRFMVEYNGGVKRGIGMVMPQERQKGKE